MDESWEWTSWIASANEAGCGFPLQNLPFCAFEASEGVVHLGVGIGNLILDLQVCSRTGLLNGLPGYIRTACGEPTLNKLMGSGKSAMTQLRQTLMGLMKLGVPVAQMDAVLGGVRPMEGAKFCKPIAVANYTDFYASVHHATSVGRLFRPDAPLLPNYKHVPIGYNGRVSSLVVGGSDVVRPKGQVRGDDGPVFGPSMQLDYELEVGAYMARGNELGTSIGIDAAEDYLFGVSLVNDWSARDVQSWESQPLGPFLGKSFATSVGPFVVSMEALKPFRVPLSARTEGDPEPLDYLKGKDATGEGIDLTVEAWLLTKKMREAELKPVRLSSGTFREMYWSFAQMVAHHTSNGCNLMAGDLLASGTVSGPEAGSEGCLLERTKRGTEPAMLPNGEARAFLEDGDEVILRGFCEREGLPRIGLGECSGTVVAVKA